MITSYKTLLNDALKGHYAVGAFNCLSLENAIGAIKAAEELNSPIILELAEVQFPYSPIELMAPILISLAKSAKVPVCVHLDHGQSFETCAKAISLGFNSVMIDSSLLPFEENISITHDVVKMSKAFGVDVEAELGMVGTIGVDDQHQKSNNIYTDVEQAEQFVNRTEIDSLAIAIGNMHGNYVATPHLNIQRLKEIKQRINLPLVLHGGSGTSEKDFKECIHNGICKINVATAIQIGVTNKIKSYINGINANYIDMKYQIVEATEEVVSYHLHLFESVGKA
jgi:fructose-bisphosphate aldolase class II